MHHTSSTSVIEVTGLRKPYGGPNGPNGAADVRRLAPVPPGVGKGPCRLVR